MGYRILYHSETMQVVKEKRKNTANRLITALLFFLLILGCLKFVGWDKLMHYLLPGDPEVTETALSGMVESIRTGESVKDAITAFCLEILDHAKKVR